MFFFHLLFLFISLANRKTVMWGCGWSWLERSRCDSSSILHICSQIYQWRHLPFKYKSKSNLQRYIQSGSSSEPSESEKKPKPTSLFIICDFFNFFPSFCWNCWSSVLTSKKQNCLSKLKVPCDWSFFILSHSLSLSLSLFFKRKHIWSILKNPHILLCVFDLL